MAFEKSPALHRYISWFAAVYLGWLAFCLLRGASGAPVPEGGAEPVPVTAPATRNPYLRGLLCNLLNPKAVIFLASVSADFMKGDRPAWWPYAIVGVVAIQGGVLWALWARLLQWPPLRSRYERSARWIDEVFGAVLAVLAVKLLVGA